MDTFHEYITEANGNVEYNNASVGDIVEGLFACDVTAAYMKKGTKVNERDIYKILRDVMSSGKNQASYEISDMRFKGIEDHILCRIRVPEKALEVLRTIKQY
jgi:hypothetical protein